MRFSLHLLILAATILSPAALASHTVTVTARDDGGTFWFEAAGSGERNPFIPLDEGTHTVVLRNDGTASHDFHIQELDFHLPLTSPGETARAAVTVTPGAGTFEYHCSPHQVLGMQGEAGKETARDSPPASWLLVLAAAVTLAAVRRS